MRAAAELDRAVAALPEDVQRAMFRATLAIARAIRREQIHFSTLAVLEDAAIDLGTALALRLARGPAALRSALADSYAVAPWTRGMVQAVFRVLEREDAPALAIDDGGAQA